MEVTRTSADEDITLGKSLTGLLFCSHVPFTSSEHHSRRVPRFKIASEARKIKAIPDEDTRSQ